MADAAGIKAGRAYVELGANDSALRAALDRAQKWLASYAASLRAVGLRFAAVGGAGLAGLGASVNKFADMGAQLARMSVRTGLSVEALSALGYAAEQTGGSLETLESAFTSLQSKVIAAAEGSREAQDSFLLLGTTWRQMVLLDPTEQFRLLAEQISRIEHPARRAQLAMQLFGSADVLPLLADGAEGISALTEEAERLGLVMDGEQARSALEMAQSMNSLKRSLQAVTLSIGSALAPVLVDLVKAALPSIKAAADWIKDNKQLVVGIATAAAAVAGLGSALLGIGTAITVASLALGGLGTLAGLVFNPITLGAAVAVASTLQLSAALFGQEKVYGGLARTAGAAWQSVKTTAIQATEGISAALEAGRFDLVFKIAATAIQLEWTKLTGVLRELWEDFKEFYLLSWDAMMLAASEAYRDLEVGMLEAAKTLASVFDSLVDGMDEAWRALVDRMLEAWKVMAALLSRMLEPIGNTKAGRALLERTGLSGLRDAVDPLAAGARDAFRPDRGQRDLVQRGLDRFIDGAEDQARLRRLGIRAGQEGREGERADLRRQQVERRQGKEQELADLIAEAQAAAAAARLRGDEDRQRKQPPPLFGSLKADVQGTFSAAAAAGFGGTTVLDRVAAGVVGLNEIGRDILNEVKNPRRPPVVRD